MSTFIIVLLSIGVLFIIIGMASTKKKPKPVIIFDQYTPNGKIWMLKLWEIYKSGETWDKSPDKIYDDYEKLTGDILPAEFPDRVKEFNKKLGIVEDWLSIGNEKNMEYQKGSFEFEVSTNITMRWHYQYRPRRGKNEIETMKNYGLNIFSDETLLWNSTKIDWYEQKTISTNISYSGFRF